LRETVMELCHELPSAGHKGTERTLSKIKDKFHWYNMSSIRGEPLEDYSIVL
jgi:hypothetical protein